MAPHSIDEVSSEDNLRRALRFVRQDKEDEPVKDPLGDIPFFADPGMHLRDLAAKLRTARYQPQDASIVEAPKGSFTTRPVSQLALDDWVVAQGILNVIADGIDQRVPDCSYSYRVNPNRDASSRSKFFRAWYSQWPAFRRQMRQALAGTCQCLVVTDIAGFYEHVDLNVLKDMLLDAGTGREVTALIVRQLETWTWRSGYAVRLGKGLLQGSDVTSVYANFYLSDVDKTLVDSGFTVFRYMDDINILVTDKARGKKALALLNRLLRDKGLSLNAAKTTILDSPDDVERHFGFALSDELEDLLRAMRGGDTATLRRERRRILRAATRATKRNDHVLRRVLTAFTRARDPGALKTALEWLAERPDLTPHICKYLRSLRPATKVAALLLDFLNDPGRNIYPFQEQMLLECLALLTTRDIALWDEISNLCQAKLSDPSVSSYSRCLYSMLLYKYGSDSQLENMAQRYLAGQDRDTLLRKYLALAVTGLNNPDLTTSVIERLKKETEPDLTDLGVFMDSVKEATTVRTYSERIGLIQDHYVSGPVWRLSPRHLYLLNILRLNQRERVLSHLINRLADISSKVDCPRTRQLVNRVSSRV